MSKKPTNPQVHPLKQWMRKYKVSSEKLGAEIGLTGATIRNIYRRNTGQKETYVRISRATGISEAILMFPENYPGFDIEQYEPIQNCSLCRKATVGSL